MTNLILRDAEAADKEAIRAVTLAAYEQYAAPMGPIWKLYLANIESTLADVGPAEQIVAEQDGRIVGTVLLYPPGNVYGTADGEASPEQETPEVRLLAVPPDARGQGIGKALMLECIRRARESGETVLTLHTGDIMAAAMAMYEQLGFVRAPELDFTPAPNVLVKGYWFDLTEAPTRTDGKGRPR